MKEYIKIYDLDKNCDTKLIDTGLRIDKELIVGYNAATDFSINNVIYTLVYYNWFGNLRQGIIDTMGLPNYAD